jgi:FMN phosphatase YigB (HAD superfamily)
MRFKLLICDMDNTLYDWVSYFVPSFYAMVDATVNLLGCDRDRLLDDFREVHQRHHDSEQPFALLETRTVSDFFKGLEKKKLLKHLIHLFTLSTLRENCI